MERGHGTAVVAPVCHDCKGLHAIIVGIIPNQDLYPLEIMGKDESRGLSIGGADLVATFARLLMHVIGKRIFYDKVVLLIVCHRHQNRPSCAVGYRPSVLCAVLAPQ